MSDLSPNKLRTMDYANATTGQCVFGIQAWVCGRWVDIGIFGGRALWASAAGRDAALEWFLEHGCSGRPADLLDEPGGSGQARMQGALWEPAAMVRGEKARLQ